jgi:hypothetical protein
MPEPHLRASDADRIAVADALGTHMSTGRLTVAEYDERLARAYAARTYGELAELTADLPATERPPVAQPTPQAASQPAPAAGCGGWGRASMWTGGTGRRAAWGSWVTTAVIGVVIWVVSCVAAAGVLYPWPVWVIGPWGVVLLAQSLGRGPGRGGSRAREHRHG